MHRLMNVADKMNHHFQRQSLIGVRQSSGLQFGDLLIQRSDDVATMVERHRFVSLVGIDVFIVPRLGVSIFGLMAGIVKPVGVIDNRFAVECSLYGCLCIGSQMAFGNVSHNVVTFLSPAKARQ